MLRYILLILVGVSVGFSLAAMALHIVAGIRTKDWVGQIGFITTELGWTLVMLPILRALSLESHVQKSALTEIFTVGVVVIAIGFIYTAIEVNRTNRLFIASAAKKIGIEVVEEVIKHVEINGEEKDT
jgi:hypothetical protein